MYTYVFLPVTVSVLVRVLICFVHVRLLLYLCLRVCYYMYVGLHQKCRKSKKIETQ